VSLDWGLAACPLTYDPPVSDPAELRSPDSQHRLVNLQGVPIAIVTGEASFMGLGDADTVAFLQRTGCDVEHVRLADHGVHGNGHLMMMERNNREALQPILDWLQRHE
jgi:hypothetical protein